jgi:hypothetical protein
MSTSQLAALYSELKVFCEGGSQYGLVQKPKKVAGMQYLFVNRLLDELVHTLDVDSQPVYVSNDLALRGALVDLKVFEKKAANPKYKDTVKLDLFFTTPDGQKFAIRTGYESVFGKGAIYSLNAFSAEELKDIVLGWKPGEDDDKKTVYAEVSLPDGSWKAANREISIEQAVDQLLSKITGEPSAFPKQQNIDAPKPSAPAKKNVAPKVDTTLLDDVDFDQIPF